MLLVDVGGYVDNEDEARETQKIDDDHDDANVCCMFASLSLL